MSAVPVNQLRAAIALIGAEDMTPTAKRVLESVCEQHDQPLVPNAYECHAEGCHAIGRIDPEDLDGDTCPNCGNQSVTFVRIEVIR